MNQVAATNLRQAPSPFRHPPALRTHDGLVRRVGFELEFSGVSLDDASGAVADALGARVEEQSSAEHKVVHSELGDFAVEIDWKFLKDQARSVADDKGTDWTVLLRELSKAIVPVEVVCPPVPIDQLDKLEVIVERLRNAGAEGTTASPIAAFGVHVNPEAPDMQSNTLHRYLRAFCLLQWWLLREHDPDLARRLGPHINPYPTSYLHSIHGLVEPTVADLRDHYLSYNNTRNRALDMLPIFAEDDEVAVLRATEDSRIKPRPAFHYRLPNCHIDRGEWSLAQSWNRWCVVEELASDPASLDALTAEFELDFSGPLSVDKSAWVRRMDRWIQDRGLA